MKWKKVLIRELDGSERTRLELERRIIKPKFRFEDKIEEIVWELAIEEEILPFLKEEIREVRKGLRKIDIRYLYGCPYCNFKSDSFMGFVSTLRIVRNAIDYQKLDLVIQ